MQQEETRAAAGTGSDPEPAQAAAIREAAQAEPGEAAQLVPAAADTRNQAPGAIRAERNPAAAGIPGQEERTGRQWESRWTGKPQQS